MSRNNFHTHTIYCDGKDTPEELVKYAIQNGCTAIGFSGHSFNDFYDADPFCMTPVNTEKYKAEVRRLKEKYKDKITILLGVERDYYSETETDDYDYVIGSVHYVLKNGFHIPVDMSRQSQIDAVNEYYGGDFYAFAEDYYDIVGDIFNKTKCDIIGHFDLVTKFNENNDLFDTNDARYVSAANKALEKLLKEDVIFEINYGAVARGYRTSPYPEKRITDIITANGKKILYTSDCHDKEYLLLGIPDTETPQMI